MRRNPLFDRRLALLTLALVPMLTMEKAAESTGPPPSNPSISPPLAFTIETRATEICQALREQFPNIPISQELERAFVDAWQAALTREIRLCPSPTTFHLDESADRVRNSGANAVVRSPALRHPDDNKNPHFLDDPTIPPDDTLTTWIKVFDDLDEDGEYDAGEPGLNRIQVSNGMINTPLGPGSTLTGADGIHTFRTVLWDSRFVFVTVPSGWMATTPFAYRLNPEVDPDSLYIGLKQTPETAEPNFRFVQMTDMQVGNEIEEGYQHGDDLTEIESLAVPPAFIVITGDLVQTGWRDGQWENYLTGESGHDTIPIHHGYGDHDGIWDQTVALEVHNFEEWMDLPTCYSFEYGGIHFIMFNDIHSVAVNDPTLKQFGWLMGDIVTARARAAPDPLPVIICKHTMPGHGELGYYALLFGADVEAMGAFSGHWHGSRVRDLMIEGLGGDVVRIFDVNTPPSRYAGIDKSSRGFRIVDLDDGELTTQYRKAGIVDHLRIVAPADGDSILAGPIQLRVNSYSSISIGQMVDFELIGPAGSGGILPMTREGPWAWSAQWDATEMLTGPYELIVYVTPDVGSQYQDSAEFELVRGEFVALPDPYSSNWPCYKHDAAGTGRSSDDLAPPLRLAWAKSLGGPINVPSATVAAGRVYVGTSNISTTSQARMFCLDASTGALLWERGTSNDVKSTPAIADGRVVFTNSTGTVFSLDATTGNTLWQSQLRDSLQRWEMTSPTCHDGVVYVGGAPAMSALNAANGLLLWQHSASNTDFVPAAYSAAAIHGDVVVFTNKAGIFAYDRTSGNQIWSVPGLHRSAAIVDSLVYSAGITTGSQTLRVYDLMTGTLLHEATATIAESTSGPVVGPILGGPGNRVIIGHGGSTLNNPGRLESYVPPYSTVDWEKQLGELITTSAPYKRDVPAVNSTAAWAGDYVYFGGDDGILYCLDAQTGKELWHHDLGVPIRSSPAIAGNMLFVNGSDGTLYAFVSTFLSPAAVRGHGRQPILRTRLIGGWPNPFNATTTLAFDLASETVVKLRIYDVAGRLVNEISEGTYPAGHHAMMWTGRSAAGQRVSSGIYFVRLEAGSFQATRRIVMIE